MKENIKRYLENRPKLYLLALEIHIWLYRTKNAVLGSLFYLCPVQNNKIVICNHFGNGYGDNGKYIAEEIMSQDLAYDIVWLVKKDIAEKLDFPEGIRTANYDSIKGLYELATAKIWIDNWRKTFYPVKKNKQYYIQTWHGSLGVKKIEKDIESSITNSYIRQAKKDSKITDLCISNGDHISRIYKKSFWYNGDVLVSGSPRNDIVVSHNKNDLEQKVRKYFKLGANTKIALYAPTFRKTTDVDLYNLDYSNCIDSLSKRFGGEWVVLVRLHPNISEKADQIAYDQYVHNASLYDDMQELLAVSDILISDYSSAVFDFTLKRTPCFLYVPDLQEYMNNDREFYFNLKELPFPYATTNKEFINIIDNFDEETYHEGINDFLDLYNVLEDGNASKRIVERIKDVVTK